MSNYIFEEKCLMYLDGSRCKGYTDVSDICGTECPYRKTPSQQKAIEKKILERYRSGVATPAVDFRSNIDGKILYPAFGDFGRRPKRRY